jgi:hypothetical protein
VPFRSRPRSGPRHRAGRAGSRALASTGVAWPLVALGLVALLGVRAMQGAVRPGEGSLTADGYLRSLGAADGPLAAFSPEGAGATHVAVYATLTRAFDRYGSLVTAGRELFLVAAIGSAALLWRTARRLGLGDQAAAAAVVLGGVPALLLPLALVDVPAALAVPWLLLAGFLTVSGRATRAARIGAVLAGAVAALLAPVVLLLALSAVAAFLVLGRTSPARTRTLRTAAAALLGAGFLAGGVLLRDWGAAGTATLPDGVRAAAVAVFLVTGILAAWRLPALRPAAVALVATTVAALASALLLDVLLVCLPVAALLAGALLQDLFDAAPARRGIRSSTAVLRIGAAVVLVGVCVAAVVSWPGARAHPTGRAPRALLAWAGGELPEGAHLLVPRRLRAELLHAGADADEVLPPGARAGADPSAPVLVVVEERPPDGAAVVARFEGPIVVVDPAPGTPTAEELQRRRSLAAAILANPRTTAGDQADRVLRSAAVDQRLLSVLAALTAQSGVGIAEFPAPAAEPDDGLPARRALLDSFGSDDLRPGAAATDRLVTWLDAQRGPFAPDSVAVTDRGVLIGYRYVSDPDAVVTGSVP